MILTVLQQFVLWTVSSFDAFKCCETGGVTWGRVFLVEHVFRCGGQYTKEVQQKFAEMFPESHRNSAAVD
jgi:hypothetical protein